MTSAESSDYSISPLTQKTGAVFYGDFWLQNVVLGREAQMVEVYMKNWLLSFIGPYHSTSL